MAGNSRAPGTPIEPITEGVAMAGQSSNQQTFDFLVQLFLDPHTPLTEAFHVNQPTYTFTNAHNLASMRALFPNDPDINATPIFTIVVQAVGSFGELGKPARLQVIKDIPDAPLDGAVYPFSGGVGLEWQYTLLVRTVEDYRRAAIYFSADPNDPTPALAAYVPYPQASYLVNIDNTKAWYWWVTVEDHYGQASHQHFVGRNWAASGKPVWFVPNGGYAPYDPANVHGQLVTMYTLEPNAQIYFTRDPNGIRGWRLYDPNNPPMLASTDTFWWAYEKHGANQSIVTGPSGVWHPFLYSGSPTGCANPCWNWPPDTYPPDHPPQHTDKLIFWFIGFGMNLQLRYNVALDPAIPADPTPTSGTLIAANHGHIDLQRGTWNIKIIAFKTGLPSSAIVSGQWTITPAGKVGTPVLSPTQTLFRTYPQQIHITCPTTGAIIYYDLQGRRPPGQRLALPPNNYVNVNANTVRKHLVVVAKNPGLIDSDLVDRIYSYSPPPPAVLFTPPPGQYPASWFVGRTIHISIPNGVAGQQIRYTTNGSSPFTGGTVIPATSGNTTVIAPNTHLNACSFDSLGHSALVTHGLYTQQPQLGTPVLAPPSDLNAVNYPISVVVTHPDPLATLVYTTDGTTPSSAHGTAIASGGVVSVYAGQPLNVMAFRDGYVDSVMAVGSWGAAPSTPEVTITPSGGAFDQSQLPLSVILDARADGSFTDGVVASGSPTLTSSAAGFTTADIGLTVTSPTLTDQSLSDGVSINGSPIFSSASANFVPSDVGKVFVSVNYPTAVSATTIVAVLDGATIQLSTDAIADGTAQAFTIQQRIPVIPIDTQIVAVGSGSVTLSQPAIASASPIPFTIMGRTPFPCTIAYTLDNTPPSQAFGFQVPAGTAIQLTFDWPGIKIRAIAFQSGYSDSQETSAVFELSTQPPGMMDASFADGASTSGSPTYTSATANFTASDVGLTVSGMNIPYGTTILAVVDAATITLSQNATGTGTALTFIIRGRNPTYPPLTT